MTITIVIKKRVAAQAMKGKTRNQRHVKNMAECTNEKAVQIIGTPKILVIRTW
jgi:hypothetical protein